MTTGSKAIFIDTNVLIYQTFEDYDREKHERARRAFQYFWENNYEIFISSQVLREYYAVSTKGVIFERPLEVKETLLKIEEYMNHFKVLYGNGVSLTILKEIAAKYHIRKKDIHDANIVATMLANRLKSIFTFNIKDFNFYEEIKLFKMDL